MLTYDIESLLISHGIKIEKKTSTHFVVKCIDPGHDDSTPSLSIRRADGYFNCFGCGIHGGPVSLYKLITKENLNLDFDYFYKSDNRKKNVVEEFYPEIEVKGMLLNPLNNSDIRSWLFKYGVEKDSFIKDREVQYSDYCEIWALHDNPDIPLEPTIMYQRICSPIYHNGQIINYEGRSYSGKKPKVLYVKNGRMSTVYNWSFLDLNKDVVVVEGIKGLWRVWNVEPNVVALFHAIPGEEQLNILKQIKGKVIYFRDNDEGGLRGIKALQRGLAREIQVCYDTRIHPDGKGYDPNDCTLKEIEFHLSHTRPYNGEEDIITEQPKKDIFAEEYLDTRRKK